MMPTVPFRGLCDNAPRVFTELQHQLRMLDRFLSCYYLDKAASATIAMLRKIDADTWGHDFDPFLIYSHNQEYLGIVNSDEAEAEATLRKREFENLQVLLIFRAILYAAILDLCADTSFVYDGTWRDSIVKIL
jgi:hypothetical protein